MMKTLGFQKKLTLGFTFISLLSMGICGLITYYFVSGIVQKLTLESMTKELDGVHTAIEISSKDNISRIAKMMDYWSSQTLSEISVQKDSLYFDNRSVADHKLVDKVAGEIGGVSTLFLRTKEGFVRVSTNIKSSDGSRAVGTLLDSKSDQAKALMKGDRFVGQAHLLGSKYYVAYEPIRHKGEIIGAFFIGTLDYSDTEILNFLKSQKLLESGYFFVLNSKGDFILHPTLQGENALGKTDFDGNSIFQRILAKKEGTLNYRWKKEASGLVQDTIALFEYFPEQDWFVTASLDQSEVNAPVVKLEWTLLLVSTVMTVFMLLMTVLFGKSVARQLGLVTDTLSQSSDQVEKGGIELAEVSEQLAQASTQQAASIQETVSALDEINAMVGRNLEATKEVEKLSVDMSSSANNGQQILQSLREAIDGISQKNTELGSEMKASHHEMEKIIEVISQIAERTKVIHDIVFQTKLLSFNASVEAARAGEHGKGFSVVAEEVGRLATMSGAAALEIQKNLELSRKQVQDIIHEAQTKMNRLSEESQGEIKHGVDVSIECQSVFKSLIEQIGQAHASIQNITQASQEQSHGIREINKAAAEMDKAAHENSDAAQKVRELAGSLSQDSVTMEGAVGDLSSFLKGQQAASEKAAQIAVKSKLRAAA